MLPLVEALRALQPRTVQLRMLAPPYAAVGLGALRVLRVRDGAALTDVTCGYDGYRRL